MKGIVNGMIVSAFIWMAIGAILTLLWQDNGNDTCTLTHSEATCYNALNR